MELHLGADKFYENHTQTSRVNNAQWRRIKHYYQTSILRLPKDFHLTSTSNQIRRKAFVCVAQTELF